VRIDRQTDAAGWKTAPSFLRQACTLAYPVHLGGDNINLSGAVSGCCRRSDGRERLSLLALPILGRDAGVVQVVHRLCADTGRLPKNFDPIVRFGVRSGSCEHNHCDCSDMDRHEYQIRSSECVVMFTLSPAKHCSPAGTGPKEPLRASPTATKLKMLGPLFPRRPRRPPHPTSRSGLQPPYRRPARRVGKRNAPLVVCDEASTRRHVGGVPARREQTGRELAIAWSR
jgi:hypothetical protein